MDEDLVMLKRLEALREKHRELDERLKDLTASLQDDTLMTVRLKKEKLALRDKILLLERDIYPDIIA